MYRHLCVSTVTSIKLQVRPYERVFEHPKRDSDEADVQLLSQAADLLRERVYVSEGHLVHVQLDWAPLIERRRLDAERNALIDPDADEPLEGLPPVDVTVRLVDEREEGGASDLLSFVELFLHESFLILNVAVPGSFGGRMRWSWDGFAPREVLLDARVFEVAWVTAASEDWPRLEALSLSNVKAWYDALAIGTQQVAMTGTVRALFHLLYLARGDEEDTISVLRLALALEAVFDARGSFLGPRIESILGPTLSLHDELQRFIDGRDAMILGAAPVAHPMYDDALDTRADDASLDYTAIVDFASRVIVGVLQQQVRSLNRLRLVV